MIHFDQPELWTAAAMQTVLLAAQIVEARLGAPFGEVFGEQHVRYNNGGEFYEYSTGNTLVFHRNKVYLQLVIHALGHTFDRRAELQPQIQLAKGRFNLRHGLLFPGMHPPSMEGGNEPNERWANTWENWIMQTLAPNIFGDAISNFMDYNLPEWVAIAREG